MKTLTKKMGVLFFCFVFVFEACNATSVNIESFYKSIQEGKVISIDLCNKVIIDVLEKVSAIAVEKTNLNDPNRVVSVGTEEELDGEVANYMNVLQNVDKVLKGLEDEGNYVVALQQQLIKVFKIYSECDDGFQQNCQAILAKIKALSSPI